MEIHGRYPLRKASPKESGIRDLPPPSRKKAEPGQDTLFCFGFVRSLWTTSIPLQTNMLRYKPPSENGSVASLELSVAGLKHIFKIDRAKCFSTIPAMTTTKTKLLVCSVLLFAGSAYGAVNDVDKIG